MLKKDKALCIRAIDYSDTSQIVTFFTKDNGKISAIAKGAKRRKSSFGGPIEILSCGDIIFSQKDTHSLATLTEFDQLGISHNLRKNMLVLNSAFFTVELLNIFTHEADKHPQLFDSLIEFITDIQTAPPGRETLALLILFQFTLLSQTGVLPILRFCLNCKTPLNHHWLRYYFSSAANGMVCHDCQPSFPDRTVLTPDVAKCLSDLKHIKDAKAETIQGIERLLIAHFTEISGKHLKMAKFITL